MRKTTIIDAGWRRLETLYDLFEADTARTELGLPDNWITAACRNIRGLHWYVSIPVSELEQRLKSLPWWVSQLPKDHVKPVSEGQRKARAANIQKARQAKAGYAAEYKAPHADTATYVPYAASGVIPNAASGDTNRDEKVLDRVEVVTVTKETR